MKTAEIKIAAMKTAETKTLRIALPLLLLLAATTALAQTSAQKSFDQLKSLSGAWEGKDAKGTPTSRLLCEKWDPAGRYQTFEPQPVHPP